MKIDNCRELFLNFAKQKGFDPYQPENWYKVKCKQLLVSLPVGPTTTLCMPYQSHLQGGQQISFWHGGMKKALRLAFPEVTFDKWAK